MEHSVKNWKATINRTTVGQPLIQDDPSDVVTNRIGMHLYKTQSLSIGTLMWWIYVEKENLNRGLIIQKGENRGDIEFVPPVNK